MAGKVTSFLVGIMHPKGLVSRVLLLAALAAGWWLGEKGYLEPVRAFLESPSLTLKLDQFVLSPYLFLRGLFVILLFFWVASFLTTSVEARINKLEAVRATNRPLVTKVFQIFIYSILSLMALDVLGVDLAAFTVLGGAVGIGLGFGLQKIASNFISGLILLLEKSVKTGDLIELDDGTSGFVRRTGGRYTLLETFDSREIMIPNEDFITSRVVNCTYSNPAGRVQIAVGVAYGTDYELAQKCILEAALEHPMCSKTHEAQCFMEDFADSSVNFLLYFWVDDVTKGRKAVRSDVLFSIARKFDAHGIVIPFPQRDVNLKHEAAVPKAVS